MSYGSIVNTDFHLPLAMKLGEILSHLLKIPMFLLQISRHIKCREVLKREGFAPLLHNSNPRSIANESEILSGLGK